MWLRLHGSGGEVGWKLELLKSTEKSLLSKGRYFRRMVTLETGYGITQVVKASVNISQNTIQDYTQPEDQFPVSTYLLCFPVCHCWNIGIEKKDISWTLHSVIKRGLVYEDIKISQNQNGGCCGEKKTRFKCSARGEWLAENNSIVSVGTLVLAANVIV